MARCQGLSYFLSSRFSCVFVCVMCLGRRLTLIALQSLGLSLHPLLDVISSCVAGLSWRRTVHAERHLQSADRDCVCVL